LFAQPKQAVFLVLYSDVAISAIGDTLKAGDYLAQEDEFTIRNGILILNHYSGVLLEVDKRGTYSIKELNEQVPKMPEDMNLGFYRFLLGEPVDRMLIEFPTGAVPHSGPPPYEIIFPFNQNLVYPIDQKLCVEWKELEKSDTAGYEIALLNIFDEPIDKIHTEKTLVEHDISTYKPDADYLIIHIIGPGQFADRTRFGIKLSPSGKYSFVTPCSATRPIEWLQLAAGFYLNKEYEAASKYARLALKYSEHRAYRKLLSHILGDK